MKATVYSVFPDGTLRFLAVFDNYREAVELGMSDCPRSFTVDTGSYVPSREEQLLIEDAKPLRRRYRKSLVDSD